MKILIFFLFFTFSLFSQESLKGKTMYVVTESGSLNMRSKAPDGKVIQKIPKGEKVKVLEVGGSVDSIPYGWLEIEYSKKKGFVSREFLAIEPPENLEKLSLIGYLVMDSNGNKSLIRPIAYSTGKKWEGAGGDDTETNYFLKMAIKNKTPFTILSSSGSELTKTQITAIEKSGCQENLAGKGNLPSKFLKTDESLFVVHSTNVSPVKLTDKVSSAFKTEVKKLARPDFLKSGASEETLNFEWKEKFNLVDSSKGKFLISRIGLVNEGAEYYNLIYIHETDGNKLGKLVFKKVESLPEETRFYGGAFHLEGSFLVSGKLILLFHDNGFDGYIMTIYEWDGKELKLLAAGGGDAC